MAKARAIVKRRKAVRNIRKITKTMQMIATAKFQKFLKRTVGSKPYTRKIRELVGELASSIGEINHPLLNPAPAEGAPRAAVIVITSNRGLCGAYNGSVLRNTMAFIREFEAAGGLIDLYVFGKKGTAYFNYQKRPIAGVYDFGDNPKYDDIEKTANFFMGQFTEGKIQSLYISGMNFITASSQKPEVQTILPLSGLTAAPATAGEAIYDFSPKPGELLDYLLPLAVKSAMFQCFLDGMTSEHVSRMVAMTAATDNADKIVKSLSMEYNRARQTQITTELSEIMGGVEAMKG